MQLYTKVRETGLRLVRLRKRVEPIRPPLYIARWSRSACSRRVLPSRTTADGALMEQSGRNWWQPVAMEKPKKGLKEAKTVAMGCDRLPFGAHGKEGVDGSSPSEGLA